MSTPVPTSVTAAELHQASERVGERSGWDFSRLRVAQEEGPWRYQDVVGEVTRPDDRVVDTGTGGGEVLAELIRRQGWQDNVALDHQLSMATVARRHLGATAAVVVADAIDVPLADEAVDVVLNRHNGVSPSEVARILRLGGRFVMQQVGGRNAQSLFDAFGWGSNWDQFRTDPVPPRTCEELAGQFTDLGMTVERIEEYQGRYTFLDLDSLVFFLKAAPFPENFDPDHHLDGVNRLLSTAVSDLGIETTEHRELLVVVK